MSESSHDRRESDRTDGEVLLSVEDLVAGYGLGQVLRGIDFEVGRGEVVSLIGRNGAGKTTTLESILGNVPEIAGTIQFDGTDVTELSNDETISQGIAYVPEERRVFPGLTVRENLEVAQVAAGNDRARDIDTIIGMFENLQENEQSLGSEMSGGEQQMLAIARALVSGAELLMLDEPTEGLAPYIVRSVEETIKELNESGITILLVEQNVQVAMEVSDTHYVINQGEVVYEGTSADLEENQQILDQYLGISS
ncbi:ABC transporter ATP-binding protein [Natrialba sp. INN-245]|uniref:ABC transporter ATP-binding protein n=1 Tax=Natrialba sp. INN-245 TaxID=2690967 RepID=UPI0013130553|nr:ABC transporter ATP-binding protein [Natrialba sp. INN-245]MWV38463.1 ATP-binding cassette domain-containing protein [Natrialba sp. INN-245]